MTYRCSGCGETFINEVSEAETDEAFARQFPHATDRVEICEECMIELVIALKNDPEAMRDPEIKAFVLSFS